MCRFVCRIKLVEILLANWFIVCRVPQYGQGFSVAGGSKFPPQPLMNYPGHQGKKLCTLSLSSITLSGQ